MCERRRARDMGPCVCDLIRGKIQSCDLIDRISRGTREKHAVCVEFREC